MFDLEPVTPPVPEKLGVDARRTARYAVALGNGAHPIGLCFGFPLRLHKDAPPADDKNAPGPRWAGANRRDPGNGGDAA
jgi:hypothetical protein